MNIEACRNIIRAKGINFSTFKRRVNNMLVPAPRWDEDYWVDLYNTYAERNASYTQTVKDWAMDMFMYCTRDEHGFRLKKKFK